MKELPWFIWEEVMSYTFSPDYLNFCFINKSWYIFGAERYSKLNKWFFHSNKDPSNWSKLAKKLEIEDFSKLNLSFLNECHAIEDIEFKINKKTKKIPKCFVDLVPRYPLKFVHFKFKKYVEPEASKYFFNSIKGRLQTLHIECRFEMHFPDSLLEIYFPNLVEFKAVNYYTSLNLSAINRFMPKLERLTLKECHITFEAASVTEPNYLHLKELNILDHDLCYPGYDFSQPHNFDDFFQFYFPVLESFKLVLLFKNLSTKKFTQSMPRLKCLELYFPYNKCLIYPFPDHGLPHLEKLSLISYDNYCSDVVVDIDFSNLPLLNELRMNPDFNLINFGLESKENLKTFFFLKTGNHLRPDLKFNKKDYPETDKMPYRSICNLIPYLNKFSIDCQNLINYIGRFLKLCSDIKHFSLYNLDYFIPKEALISLTFKATHFEISGEDFINNDLFQWLDHQFQFTHLTISCSRIRTTLDQVQFSSLFHLKLGGCSGTHPYLREMLVNENVYVTYV